MNAVVAIGGATLQNTMKAYRKLVPSEVWVLGLKTPRDLNDEHVRSLESLVEPLMQPYFAAEAERHVAAISSRLAAHLLPAGCSNPRSELNAVSATMCEAVAASLALVAMLDRAHLLTPIELVIDDDSTILGRAAIAWARTRGLPSVTVPARASLRRPRKPVADRTLVVGERNGLAYRLVEINESLLVHVSTRQQANHAMVQGRSAARIAAKAALERVLGWKETDVVVVFEPATVKRNSALEPADGYKSSLTAIFDAFVIARLNVPSLRLAIVGPVSANGNVNASKIAAASGLAGGDFAYAEADYDVWMAAADIAVSVDSMRSIDAAGSGVPAINLWRAANWSLGAAFSAEDGIIDVAPQVLGPTLIALASDANLRFQIATIAGDRIVQEGTVAQSTDVIAGELLKCRRAAKRVARKPSPDIVIYAPPFANGSAGLRALYRLCHFINLMGGDASIYPGTQLHPTWNTPRRDTALTDQTIVVYPEIYFQMLPARRVVRWCLNEPGLLGGPKSYGPDEMVFYYHPIYRAAAQAATAEILTDERELQIALLEPELFYHDHSKPRLYDCVFVYKGQPIYDRVQPREIRDAYIIQSNWPANRSETATLLRGCRKLYSFDSNSAIVMEAIICGAQVYLVQEDGEAVRSQWNLSYLSLSDHAREYYDMSHVERFLRLLKERWG